MVSEKETARIRRFVCRQLDNEPDLSTLTLGILKQRYLAREGCETLSPEAKHFMKQVVKEELMKMQENDQNGCELETKMPQNKRKREKENDEVISEGEDESRAKKSRRQLNSSSESEDKEDRKTGSEESEEEEQIKTGSEDEEKEVKKSNENSKRQINSEDSAGEEKNESETSGSERSCADSPKEKVKKKPHTTKNGAITSSNTSRGKKTPQSDEEDEDDSDDSDNGSEKSDKNNENESAADSEKEEKVSVEKKTNESDSDSSSLPSLDEQDSGTENKKDTEKKKTVKTKESSKSQKEENKAVVRLKRYISLCGVRHNYKKLLQDCRSVRSMVAVLKRELEDLGVQGNPSIMKCKKIRMKREEARELAELDVSNIIATQGRPKRRGASAWQKQEDPPSSAYQRSLNSGSDSDQENTNRGRRRATDWSNLQGIISDDADSD
ncbi:HIRA-interacting protein 3 [Thunnus albacares]|uniref:HIRA-interacting protein 3 n=1 Tax=Thunnus albacares TaxID=8236 RepID=UPI001CF6FB33|nr:HIRA-interacting protein 3 [Thunnus albacares]